MTWPIKFDVYMVSVCCGGGATARIIRGCLSTPESHPDLFTVLELELFDRDTWRYEGVSLGRQ
jgi:hypothetical protein